MGLDTILSWKSSTEVTQRLIYLQFTSGRRISEIYDSEFRKNGDRISSKTLHKKRGNKAVCTFPLYPGVTPDEWLRLLRTSRRALFPTSLNALNKAVNRALRRVDNALTSHKLRGMYANLLWYFDGKRQIKTGFIRKLLCLESTEIAINYSAYIVPEKK